MDWSSPYSVVLPRIEGQVLTALAGTTRPLSGREVARISGTSINGAWRALQRLAQHGLLRTQEAGRGAALLYTLNREHVAAEAVLILADLRRRFLGRMADAIETWGVQPVHASIFGSAARGDGDVDSDVDVFLVRPDGVSEDDEQWRGQIDALARAIQSWTGNHAGIASIANADVRRLRRERPPIVQELERHAIVLMGLTPQEMFARTRQ